MFARLLRCFVVVLGFGCCFSLCFGFSWVGGFGGFEVGVGVAGGVV